MLPIYYYKFRIYSEDEEEKINLLWDEEEKINPTKFSYTW